MPQTATVSSPESMQVAHARDVLSRREPVPIAEARQGALDVAVRLERDSLWVELRRDGEGGLALRMPVFSPDARCRPVKVEGALAAVTCSGSLGEARLVVRGDPFGLEQLRATLAFTPDKDLAFGELPRDLVPFGPDGDPAGTEGLIEASQRKLNTGLLYFTLSKPDVGKVLYVQNLTALNDYFNATGSKPENAVGGEWPELGYRPPVSPETGKAVLPAGRTLVLYDTIVAIRAYPQQSEDDSAWQFLDMLGGIYPWLAPPVPAFRDWPERAESTVRDLLHAPEASIEHYGHRYFHPYTASEYPDVMVQASLASALNEWGQWQGVRHPLEREALAGLDRFYDPEIGSVRRYLPNVGPDKNANAVDSWYLYHPLLNLANLALAGADEARELFLASLDYAIRAARHFRYKWPILYDMRDFSVIQAVAEADQRGQTDVGGIYAWVMLQAFELTLEQRYLEEALAAIEAARGMRFDLNYQANLTAWGAAACIRLWRITNRKNLLTQSYVYLASFFHNAQMWKSEIGMSAHWTNFLGVTCLHDAPYMAAYECFDSYAAFERYLDYGGPDLIPSVRLLVGEYCRHALDRAWFYYPDALPAEAIAAKNRNGYINPALSFPVEDLYPDGQQAGQVGQEIYGGGAAMIYASRAFRRLEGAPFVLFCDCFIRAIHRIDGHTVSLRIDGYSGTQARLALVGEGLDRLAARLTTSSGESLEFAETDGRLECWVPAGTAMLLAWEQGWTA
jgi:hypothetical protein